MDFDRLDEQSLFDQKYEENENDEEKYKYFEIKIFNEYVEKKYEEFETESFDERESEKNDFESKHPNVKVCIPFYIEFVHVF